MDYPLQETIRAIVNPKKSKPVLDDVSDDDPALSYAITGINLAAAAAVQEWVETAEEDLDEGETLADRLLSLLIGVADPDQDDEELDEDEQEALALAMEGAWDYLTSKGVSDEDASALLNDQDNDAAVRVRDLLASSLPDGDAALEDIDSFAFDSVGLTLDAVYKKKVVIRDGKRVRINKRVSGKVRLTAKQKLAIRKAQRKAHTATATMRRIKSQRKARMLAG